MIDVLYPTSTLEVTVDADLDTLATARYVKTDDVMKADPRLVRWRPEVGIAPKLSDAELAVPVDFDARYGAGIDRGVSLGGGGLYFVAWLVGYLHGMARAEASRRAVAGGSVTPTTATEGGSR